MRIFFAKRAEKDLKKIPQKEKLKIKKKLTLLINESQSGKKLKGNLIDLCSLRSWPYRIIYQIVKDKIYIMHIMHRQEGYEKI